MSQSVQASITKIPQTGGLNNEHLFLTVLEAEKSKIKALADSVSSEDLLPDSQTAIFSLCPHSVGKGEGALWGLFYKSANPIHEGSTFMT